MKKGISFMSTTNPERKVVVEVTGAATLGIGDMEGLQEGLKTIDAESLSKLCKEIDDKGFNDPVAIWSDGKTNWILNGHQRLAALKKMESEGYTVPPIPICWVHAKNIQEARQKVLSLASQYGEVTHEGLRKFAEGLEIPMKEIAGRFRFPEIDWGLMEEPDGGPDGERGGAGGGQAGSPQLGGPAGRFVLIYASPEERLQWLDMMNLGAETPDRIKAEAVGTGTE